MTDKANPNIIAKANPAKISPLPSKLSPSLSPKERLLSYILKLIVISAAVIGTILSAIAGRRYFMGGSKVFMYFTIQSNLAIALICAVESIILAKKKPISPVWSVIKFVGTVSITLTGIVFVFVLAPTMGTSAWNIQNILTHVVVPLIAVIDFFVLAPSTQIEYKNIFYVIIPPLLYAVYAGIAYIKGWEFSDGINYPYFFLNWGSPAGAFGFSKELPFMGTVWWIISLFLFLILIGFLYLKIARLIKKARTK